MRGQHRSTRPTRGSVARVIARLAMMAVAGLLVAAPGTPAGADHVPTDIFTHFDTVTSPGLPGGVITLEVHAGVDSDPVDFTGAVTITVPTPAGTTFRDISGTLPLAVGGAPGGPPCATPAPGGTGPVVCTGAFGAADPDDETSIYVRFRVDSGAAAGGTVDIEVTASVAGDPDLTNNGDSGSLGIGAGKAIVSAGPTDEIAVTDDLNCQAHHAGDEVNSFYPPGQAVGSCSTVLLVESAATTYGPSRRGPNTDENLTPVSQTLAGTGTAADPFTIVTVADAGTSGLRLVQTDSYVVGEPQWRTDVEIVNTTGSPHDVRLYRAADCYLGGSDSGFGQLGPQAGAVACRSELGRLLQWVPITPGSNFYQAFYNEVWDLVEDQLPFPDTCECADKQDNGAGLSWDLTVPANSSLTVSHTTAILVTSVAKTADQPTTFVGQPNGYTITVTNYDSTPLSLTTIVDTLPGGFSYTPGSTTGATTADPSVAAGTLTWTGPFTVPAGTPDVPGTLALHFGVTVPTTPGNYTNEASATSAGGTVEITPSGPTAPVTVLANAPQTIVFGAPPPNPVVGGSYTPSATGGASGNPVVFTIGSGPCSIAGGVVSFTGVGTCVVNANQAGGPGFDPAPQVQQTFTIAKAPQVITFTSTPVSPTIGGTYTVTATGGGSGNPVVFTPATPAVCTVSGSTVDFVGVGTCTIHANQAGDFNYDPAPQQQQTFTVAKATPSISTVASPGNFVGAPVRDVATISGGFNPTGNVTFRLFSDAGCNTQVFTSTNALGTPSDWFTPATAGTYRWIATYNGDANNNVVSGACNDPNESVTLAPFVAPAYTRIIQGDHLGPVDVTAGESVLIDVNARVVGPVTVHAGGALTVTTAKITRGVVVDNPGFLSICGSDVSGPSPGPALTVTNAGVPIRIGDPATGCATNRFAGTVTLTANLAVTFGANAVSHATTINNGGPGATVIKANTFLGPLACSGNTPAPTNAGQPNAGASKTGQCAGI